MAVTPMDLPGSPPRTIWFDGPEATAPVAVLDQRWLPDRVVVRRWRSVKDVVVGIKEMQVRGAPLIGVAAAHGLALAARTDPGTKALRRAGTALKKTRPTAVNLEWAVERCIEFVLPVPLEHRASRLARLAQRIADEDAAACRLIGLGGVALLADIHARVGREVNILTHCNAGRLACVEIGTATAPIYLAKQQRIRVHVWVSETRPRNQGAALTAWELGDAGIDHTLVVDNAASHLMATGKVDAVIVGADRVAANGDVANKIGTALKAFAATEHGVPFYVAMPWSTYDARRPSGAEIPIEERAADEVLKQNGRPIAPQRTWARNWGFDITPARHVTAYLTPDGVLAVDDLRRVAPRP